MGAIAANIYLLQNNLDSDFFPFLQYSLINFLAAVILQVLSYWASEKAHHYQVELLDGGDLGERINHWSRLTGCFNIVLRSSFAAGLFFFIAFVFLHFVRNNTN
jgi:hypothetical protein